MTKVLKKKLHGRLAMPFRIPLANARIIGPLNSDNVEIPIVLINRKTPRLNKDLLMSNHFAIAILQ